MRARSSCKAALAMLAALGALAGPVVSACSGGGGRPSSGPSGAGPSPVTGEVTVFAAASLTETFTEIGAAFEAANRGVHVTFNFGASSALAAQLAQGAPADVFASADEANMAKVTDRGGTAAAPVVFARNRLAVIVGKGNPQRVRSVQDLARPDLIVVACSPQVPIGAYAAEVFRKAGVTVTPKSLEADVKAVVTKVSSGEADAGIVYSTDVQPGATNAEAVAIPDELNVVARYPIAVTAGSAHAPAAEAFVSYVVGEGGQKVLAAHGFVAP